MKEFYQRLISDEELRAKRFILNQITDKNSPKYGGFVEPDMHWTQPKLTIYHLTTLYALYNTKESRYFHDKNAYERVIAGLDFAARYQNPDGTFDYIDCNFASAPDTAFCIKRLLPTFRYLSKHLDSEENKTVYQKIRTIIEKAAKGICNGGFHTPNHRWAVASILMACSNIFGIKEYSEKAKQYLNEGIDCNEYGEYAERSSGNYNRINDDAMILLYEETKDTTFLDHVERNLTMMFNYYEPDGSVFTKNSTRYDSWCKFYPDNYFFEYLYMSYLRHNKTFGAASNKIFLNSVMRGEMAPDCLHMLMAHPELINYEPEGCELPETYKFINPDSNIARVRNKDMSYTVLSANPYFLYFEVGKLLISMRLGFIYFDKRTFKPDCLDVKEDGSIELNQDAKGWFYKPFKEKPATSDWWKMDNKSRELASGPELKMRITIKEEEKGLVLHLHSEGCENVPYKIEIGIEEGCFVKSEGFLTESVKGSQMVARKGNVEITKGLDSISVGPAFGSHYYIGGKDGSVDTSSDLFHVYFTGFTNVDKDIHVKKVDERFNENCDI